jgi:hypothetical protein
MCMRMAQPIASQLRVQELVPNAHPTPRRRQQRCWNGAGAVNVGNACSLSQADFGDESLNLISVQHIAHHPGLHPREIGHPELSHPEVEAGQVKAAQRQPVKRELVPYAFVLDSAPSVHDGL